MEYIRNEEECTWKKLKRGSAGNADVGMRCVAKPVGIVGKKESKNRPRRMVIKKKLTYSEPAGSIRLNRQKREQCR